MSALFSLEGKTALITGANTGLGQAIAIALAEAGADIVVAGRTDPADTAAAVRALGRSFTAVQADLESTAPVQQIVDSAVAVNGRLDILVNNAGIIARADSLDVTEQDWDRVMDTNLKSLFFLSQAAARHMRANSGDSGSGGKIINVASLLSFQGGIRVPAYTASKSAVAGLTRALANEWAQYGICVNAIAPGYFDTNNTAALRADPVREPAILARIPAGRWGDPADLAGAAVFLASRASDYVHGVVLPVDGGWLAR